MFKKEAKGGSILEIVTTRSGIEVILSITSTGGNKVMLNDIVVSSGRTFVSAGVMGRVVEIIEPFTDGFSNDTICCEFENGQTCFMKFKDLEYEGDLLVTLRK